MRVYLALVLFVASHVLASCSMRSSGGDIDGVSAQGLTPGEWASLSQRGPSHKLLDMFVGDWNAQISFWSAPGADPQRSRGTSSIRWILGDRFLQEDFKGDVVGEQFQGMGLMGYDNAARQFKTVWIDSLNTALAVSYGKFLAERNAFDMASDVYDPLLGRTKTVRSMLAIESPDKYSFSMVDTAPNGQEFTSLEILYSRKR